MHESLKNTIDYIEMAISRRRKSFSARYWVGRFKTTDPIMRRLMMAE